ncbi:MAG: UPF0262 family protein [Proteobacteria bacterium]|nr:UPF0262 family protein [Pseudomonadota bacterium]
MASEVSRIIDIKIVHPDQPRLSSDAEDDRRAAIFDLLDSNYFRLLTSPSADPNAPPYLGPYVLHLRDAARHIHFDVRDEKQNPLAEFHLAMGPLRQIMREYRLVCDSYYQAIRTKTPSQIQAIDMGRRALHDEATQILQARLAGRIEMDEVTARRLFSLISVLKHTREK